MALRRLASQVRDDLEKAHKKRPQFQASHDVRTWSSVLNGLRDDGMHNTFFSDGAHEQRGLPQDVINLIAAYLDTDERCPTPVQCEFLAPLVDGALKAPNTLQAAPFLHIGASRCGTFLAHRPGCMQQLLHPVQPAPQFEWLLKVALYETSAANLVAHEFGAGNPFVVQCLSGADTPSPLSDLPISPLDELCRTSRANRDMFFTLAMASARVASRQYFLSHAGVFAYEMTPEQSAITRQFLENTGSVYDQHDFINVAARCCTLEDFSAFLASCDSVAAQPCIQLSNIGATVAARGDDFVDVLIRKSDILCVEPTAEWQLDLLDYALDTDRALAVAAMPHWPMRYEWHGWDRTASAGIPNLRRAFLKFTASELAEHVPSICAMLAKAWHAARGYDDYYGEHVATYMLIKRVGRQVCEYCSVPIPRWMIDDTQMPPGRA